MNAFLILVVKRLINRAEWAVIIKGSKLALDRIKEYEKTLD